MTGERIYKEIELAKLKANPWNPRQTFAGPKFNDLVESIKAKGVLEPILVRPVKSGFEIIAGERRFRASCEVAKANGGMKGATIPSIIQEMTDDDAFDCMTIENLQREDLTPLEEATSFKQWIDRRKGKDKKADVYQLLADRTGIGVRYIRRRVHVLTIHSPALKAWEKGEISFGHCEQLARLVDEKKQKEAFGAIKQRHWSVGDVREHIDSLSVELRHAAFDKKKAGCPTCENNTDVQRELFGDDRAMEKASCLNPACFKKNQNEHFLSTWADKYKDKFGTNGFRFWEGYGSVKYNSFGLGEYGQRYKDPGESCDACKDFVTILEITGKPHEKKKQVCIGQEKCYQSIKQQKAKASGGSKEKAKDGPRVAWHGQHFREEFYQEVLPSWIEALNPDDAKTLRLALAAILNSNPDALQAFRIKCQGADPKKASNSYGGFEGTWQHIEKMQSGELQTAIREMALVVAMQKDKTQHNVRVLMAAHVGLDLSRDWRITPEYLDKKTTAEILDMGEKLGIFADPKVEAFLKDTLGKKKFKGLKKSELVRVYLESGIELTGKVPTEILTIEPDRRAAYLTDDDEEEEGTTALCPVNGNPCTHRQGMDCEHTVACCSACEAKCPSRCGISLTDGTAVTVDNAETSSIEGQE